MTLMTSACVHFYVLNGLPHVVDDEKSGLVRDLNPGPLAPKARIIPLDQRAKLKYSFDVLHLVVSVSTTGLVAQRIRHLTTNQGIAGSSPAKVNIFGHLTKKHVGQK